MNLESFDKCRSVVAESLGDRLRFRLRKGTWTYELAVSKKVLLVGAEGLDLKNYIT